MVFSSNWNFHQHSLSIFYIKKGSVMFTNFVIRYLETHPSVFNIMCTIMVHTKGTKYRHQTRNSNFHLLRTNNNNKKKSFSKLIQIFGEIFNSAAGHDEMQPFRKQCHKSLHFMLFADFMILLFKYPAAAIVGDVIRDARAISAACKLVMFAA